MVLPGPPFQVKCIHKIKKKRRRKNNLIWSVGVSFVLKHVVLIGNDGEVKSFRCRELLLIRRGQKGYWWCIFTSAESLIQTTESTQFCHLSVTYSSEFLVILPPRAYFIEFNRNWLSSTVAQEKCQIIHICLTKCKWMLKDAIQSCKHEWRPYEDRIQDIWYTKVRLQCGVIKDSIEYEESVIL